MAEIDKLTDLTVRKAKPAEKPVRLFDGGGLYLEIAPNGSKLWRWKYRFAGKEKRLAIGVYPTVGLREARQKRDDAKRLLAAGTDPGAARRAEKVTRAIAAANTFELVAREYHGTQVDGWSEGHALRWMTAMERDMFPWIGSLPLPDVTAPLLLQTLRRVESRGVRETTHALRQYAGQVFRYGIATGRCSHNPAADLKGALKPLNVKHMAAVVDASEAGALLRSIAGYDGQPTTKAALELSALLFQRPGNIRAMEWAEVDLEAGMWTIPAAKMKRTVHGKTNGRPHLVPLAPQAVALLKALLPLTGHGRYVFPSLLSRERPMSENTLRTALRRMGYSNDDHTAHGFRAMARTIMVEKLNVQPDVIEAQLAHGKSGPLGAAYDRAEFMDQRRQMMVLWADYLGRLRDGAEVLPFKAA